MAHHNELGKTGEDLAVAFLIDQGYEIMARNYRFQKAEVDILAREDDVLAVIEVKTRATADFGNPQDFVKPKQIKNMVKAVDAFIAEQELNLEVRFDIMAILKTKNSQQIEHLKDAFYHF